MQFINKNVHGKQAVGHIDLLAKQSYIEVPEQDAQKVMHRWTVQPIKVVRCVVTMQKKVVTVAHLMVVHLVAMVALQAVVVVTAAVAKAVKSLVSVRAVVVASMMIILSEDSISSRKMIGRNL